MTMISQGVGLLPDYTPPNLAADLQTICKLLDKIPNARGGTADTPGTWASDRAALIAEVAAALTAFKQKNNVSPVNGALFPLTSPLRLMDQLAGNPVITATVVDADTSSEAWDIIAPDSVAGTGPLQPLLVAPILHRRLVRVEGSSIKWFGVGMPANSIGIRGGRPHVFFTPSPWQGGYNDGGYATFESWRRLYQKYVSGMGAQIAAAGVPHILVIPFYTNAQAGKLGSFVTDWKETLTTVLDTAINSADPLHLRTTYSFEEIYTSSFSNGVITHANFASGSAGRATLKAFDLDGQAAGFNWRPSNGVIYHNTRPPKEGNPHGSIWHVGGRFAEMRLVHQGKRDHNMCPFLLMHGVSRFGR